MHPGSLKNMEWMVEKLTPYLEKENDILDLGGGGKLERSYKDVWEKYTKNYYVADIVDAPSVTHFMKQKYHIPAEDETFDIVVSGQCLEHVANPFKMFDEMCRVLKTSGIIIIIVPSAGPRHDVKDYWRFMDDAFEGIVEDSKYEIRVIEDYIDTFHSGDHRSGKWRDHIFVGQKLEDYIEVKV